ncbi:MAG: hypothetical protein ABIQ52_10630, partial [Vicinamibacterales bacterium]
MSRRSVLQLAGLGTAAAAVAVASRNVAGQAAQPHDAMQHAAHTMGPVGRVSTARFDPAVYLRTWNFADLAPAERARFYKETPRPDGSLLREYQMVAVDR